VRAARSAWVRAANVRPARIQLVLGQPALHERGLEHVDHVLAVGVGGPQAASARCCVVARRCVVVGRCVVARCRVVVRRPRRHWHLPREHNAGIA